MVHLPTWSSRAAISTGSQLFLFPPAYLGVLEVAMLLGWSGMEAGIYNKQPGEIEVRLRIEPHQYKASIMFEGNIR